MILRTLLMVFALLFSVQTSALNLLHFSPLTMVLELGKWVWVNSEEVYYIRVQSTAATETQAREQAFALAVDQAIGSLLISETVIGDQEVLRHEIINYSSGFVRDHEYVSVDQSPDGIQLTVDVWVAKSKLSARLTPKSNDTQDLQGGKIAQSIASLQAEHAKGDQVIKAVLKDFPNRAINVSIQNLSYEVENRSTTLVIDFAIWWKEQYTSALRQATKTVGQRKSLYNSSMKKSGNSGVVFEETACIFCKDEMFLLDDQRAKIVYRTLAQHKPYLKVTFYNLRKKAMSTQCFQYGFMQGAYSYKGKTLYTLQMPVVIYPDTVLKNQIKIDLQNIDVPSLDTVDMSVVPRTSCPE